MGRALRSGTARRGMLGVHLESALRRLLAELAEADDGWECDGPVREFLERAVRQAIDGRGGGFRAVSAWEDAEEEADLPAGAEVTSHPALARTALKSLQRLERSFVSSVLSYLSAAGNTGLEIERMFETLSGAEDALIDRWFADESVRRADLLADAVHDFRSPLTSIFFLADALYSGLSGPLSEAQRRQVGLIFTATLSLHTLVENVLSTRNIETGKLKAERVPFSVAALAEEVERVTTPLAETIGLTLRFVVECRAARVGDADVLRRILLNLVANATNYTEQGGVTVLFRDADDDLLVYVEDTGPGFNEDQMEEMFRLDFRSSEGERSGERRFSGAGLGLGICHRLAQLVGGSIWVESELGRGTTFCVQLPFPPVDDTTHDMG
jgi:signal transduction histidine kinase